MKTYLGRGNGEFHIQYVSKVVTSPPVYGTLAEMSELLKHTVQGFSLGYRMC